jgi:hypothetical protein
MKLIFVYNAKSGLGNHLMDALHKTFSPSTYDCDLCSLTYGHVGPRKEWKEFLASVNMESEFHFKDKFAKAHPELKEDFPVIYLKDKNYQLLVSATEMRECDELSQLIKRIKDNLTKLR